MTVRLDLGSGVMLELDQRTARRALDQLTGQLESTRPEDPTRLPDDHPIWGRSSGGAGHDGNPWTEDDEALAEVFYRSVSGKGRLFFDILLDRPGQLITSDEIVAASGGVLASCRSVAGAIKGLYVAHKESDRIYPFNWWEGQPTRYAVRPSVAALFNQAREGRPLMPALPQVCPMCGYGDAVTSEPVGLGVWSYICSDQSHPEYTWVASDPKVRSKALQQKDQTLSDELAIYDDLLVTFAYGEAPVEHGVVEYRYARAVPDKYRFLIDRYSHIQQERGLQYTASSFIAGALARLWRRGELHFELAPATGFWKYNEKIGAWALTDTAQSVKSWVDFATDVNLHAGSWPLDDLRRGA